MLLDTGKRGGKKGGTGAGRGNYDVVVRIRVTRQGFGVRKSWRPAREREQNGRGDSTETIGTRKTLSSPPSDGAASQRKRIIEGDAPTGKESQENKHSP